MRALVLTKWWVGAAVVFIAVGLMAFAAGRPEDPNPLVVQSVPAGVVMPGGQLLLMREDGFVVLSPDGKKLLTGKLGPEDAGISSAWLSQTASGWLTSSVSARNASRG